MATGAELVRMMICGVWEEQIKNRKDFCSAQIYNQEGKPISLKKAKKEYFCMAEIIFKKCPEGELKLLETILRMVASTRSEQMCSYTFDYYCFQKIVIC